MKINKKLLITLTILITAVLAGCASQPANLLPNEETLVAQTVEADMLIESQTALVETASAQPSITNTLIPTFTPDPTAIPTFTPTPSQTPTPRPTNTPVPTATPVPCNWASFVMDVTVPDESVFTPGTKFSKVWRLQNIGTCTWDDDYEVVFYDGNEMEGQFQKEFDVNVPPGEFLDVQVNMEAPEDPGNYQGFWILRDEENDVFGVGPRAESPFWAEINVVIPENDYKYNFAAEFCEASWQDEQETLQCQGSPFSEVNFVQITDQPSLEDGRTENEFALWMNVNRNDSIRGTYPPIEIENGDRFVSSIGCLQESRECRAEFTLSYKEAGSDNVNELGSWTESYDENMTILDIDLSSLAGQEVQFILEVSSLTSTRSNRPVWFIPSIRNP